MLLDEAIDTSELNDFKKEQDSIKDAIEVIDLEELKKGYVENKNELPVFLNDNLDYLVSFIDVRAIKENFVVSEISEVLSNEIERTKKDIDLAIKINDLISKFI